MRFVESKRLASQRGEALLLSPWLAYAPEPIWQRLAQHAHLGAIDLPGFEAPVLILDGKRDPVVPPASVEFLHDRPPNGRMVLPDAAHFIWEDAADAYAAHVTDWSNTH